MLNPAHLRIAKSPKYKHK